MRLFTLLFPAMLASASCAQPAARKPSAPRKPAARKPVAGKPVAAAKPVISPVARERISFNQSWRFLKSEAAVSVPLVSSWRWKAGNERAALTENTAGWSEAAPDADVFGRKAGFAWFRATLPPQKSALETLQFEGADDNATVFLNGQQIGQHSGWGVPFDVAVGTAWNLNGPNELAVLVENTDGGGGLGAVRVDDVAPEFGAANFNDSAWRLLNLPHDWGIEGPFQQELPGETGKLPWAGVGWYRKGFRVENSERGRRFQLEIDGAMSHSQVFCNGQRVGGWPYGYASYQLDLTPFIKFGAQNVVAIRLNNLPNSSRWYPGGGIYRNVWLTKTGPVRVAPWGVGVTTPVITANSATVRVAVEIEGAGALAVRTEIYRRAANGQPAGAPLARAQSAVSQDKTRALALQLANPQKWGLQTPQLYLARTALLQNGRIVDSVDTAFGVRTIEWTAGNGFLLNGQRVPLQGVCLHHDLGALGAAINTRALERQLEIMQEMGVNAIRTSHNPPAPELLDLCDQRGILVIDEFSDTWKTPKKPNGYARLWDNWAEKDVRAMVARDRNHPSIIAWSSGNEVGEQGSPQGAALSQFLTGIFHSTDPTRPVTAGNNDGRAGYNGFQKTLDVFGYNYKPWEYGKFHESNPTIPLYGSETASTVSARGEYFFPVSNNQGEGKSDFQVSSYDLYAPGWASPPDVEFSGQDKNPFVAGEFVWTGFDYLGEPTPYNDDSTNLLNYHSPEARAAAEKELKELGKIRVPSRSSYFGIVDLAGFKKDRFYLYQARWRPELAMAHILPHWNWSERVGQVTPVMVYTSGDEAELFLNGVSQGRRKKGPYEYRLRWNDVKYEPGELRVVAYKNGQAWAENRVQTTGEAARLSLKADRARIAADGQDLSFVTVSIEDANGLMMPRSKNALKFEISGPGEIVATDNGDATDHTSFQSKERRAYNGLALVIVRAKSAGKITVRATGAGLQSGEVVIDGAK